MWPEDKTQTNAATTSALPPHGPSIHPGCGDAQLTPWKARTCFLPKFLPQNQPGEVVRLRGQVRHGVQDLSSWPGPLSLVPDSSQGSLGRSSAPMKVSLA